MKLYAQYPDMIPTIYSPMVLDFLSKKMIDPKIAKQLRWYERKGRKMDNGEHAVVLSIPSFKGTNLVNVKYRNLSAKDGDLKFWQLKKEYGGEAMFVGMHDLELDATGVYKEIIITEGETDLATWKRVRRNVLSVPQGAPSVNAKNFEDEFRYLMDEWTITNILDRTETFILAVDNDEAGKLLEKELVLRLGKKRCKVVVYPQGCKDGNEVYIKHQQKGLDEVLSSATYVPFEGIINPMDLIKEMQDIKENGIPSGLPIGHKRVDNLFTLKPPYVYIVTGAPGSGKSTFIRYMLSQYVKQNPTQRLGLYSPEQRPYGREVIKIMEAYSGKNIDDLTEAEYQSTLQTIAQHFDFIVPRKESYKELDGVGKDGINGLSAIFQYLIHLVKSKRLSGYVIDAWNKLEHDVGRYETEHNYIGKSLDKIIEFNEANNLFSIIIAHPTKLEKKSDGNYKKPGLYSISGSAHWNNKADVGVVVHRDKYETVGDATHFNPDAHTEIIVEKMKFEELGREGDIKLFFNKSNNCFFDSPLESKAEQLNMVPSHNNIQQEGRSELTVFGDLDDFEDDIPF
jgi:twinkle protein